MRRFGVHAFAQESHVLHLLPHEAAGDAYLFAPHHHYLLAVEKFFCHNGRESTEHVVPRVNHHPLRADSRTRHHLHFTTQHNTTAQTLFSHGARCLWRRTLGFLKLPLGCHFGPSPTRLAYFLCN